MKAIGITLVGLFVAVLVLFGVGSCTLGVSYNSMNTQLQQVNASWANVQNVYQRRSDLIPNLVETVKGAADFEKSTLVAVTQARASVGQMKIDANQAPQTAEQLQKFQAAQGQLGSALSRLMVISEKYPDLKANQNFLELQAQVEGTENRISVERRNFNLSVQTYNTTIKSFPKVLFAGMFGFQSRPFFEADQNAQKAPTVKF